MKHIFTIVAAVLWCGVTWAQPHAPEIKPYTDFLSQNKHLSAKEYILSLFDTHDIVVLCEREHRELTQYDLILQVVSDPAFRKKGGMIFTEIGANNLNPQLNNFLQDYSLTPQQVEQKVRWFHRNATFFPIWEKYSWSYLAQRLYELNRSNRNTPVEWYPSDAPSYMEKPSVEQIKQIDALTDTRDSLMADYIIRQIRQKNAGTKALVIMNYRHAYGPGFQRAPGQKGDNVARYLFEAFPGQCANVMTNNIKPLIGSTDTKAVIAPVQDGKWDAAFAATRTDNVGFDFSESPFGRDLFDYFPFNSVGQTYADVFTGFVFYTPIADYKVATGIPHIAEEGFTEEYSAREQLKYESVGRKPSGQAKQLILEYNELKIAKEDSQEDLLKQINRWLK